MKAAVVKGQKWIEIEERPIPKINFDQVLIKIGAVGICGSDLHGFMEKDSIARQPGLIIGHEAAGEVVKIGSKVTRVKIGDKVAIDPQCVCGQCVQCKHGWYSVCDKKLVIGSSLRGFLDGAMAEYVAIKQDQLYKLPENMSVVEGAMIEPVSNALHVVNRANIELGDAVVVIGAGTLGLCLLQAAKLAGAGKVVVIDLSGFRLNIAKQLGADVLIKSDEIDSEEVIKQITMSRGADVVIEAVGIEKTYQMAFALVRKKGRIMFLGNAEEFIKINLFSVIYKELTLMGCSGADWECNAAIEFISSGRFKVQPIITHQLKIEKTQEAFELLMSSLSNAIKVVVIP
jgi:2-desacetyl-2-hydroxyethyl bacteriochlorophyllide A dehydrogenase